MCCCGCSITVLEPGAGFGSWRALFGLGTGRARRSSTKANDVMTEHVIAVPPDASKPHPVFPEDGRETAG
jgi:hypothetical protein